MNLSKRLRRIAEHVENAGVVADIGCDHGFTSIYLIETKRAAHAIAMDIHEEPLLHAKRHIREHRMEQQIEVRRSDGMEKLETGEADAILISGLGGHLMCRILKEGEGKLDMVKQLVLSPQSEICLVRKMLHALGFCIVHEEMVLDQKKYYVILRAVPGREAYETEEEYQYGKLLIEKKDTVFYEYICRKHHQIENVIRQMEQSSLSEKGKKALEEQKTKNERIWEMIQRFS